jgi:hypothetical protein
VLLLVWGVMRDSISENLSYASYDTLKTQAANIANLRGASANVRNINKFLREQQLLEKNRHLAENVKEINSAIELLNQVSQKVPGKRNIRLEVKRFMVENNLLEIEGLLRNAQELASLQQSLRALAADGKVQTLPTQVAPGPGQQAFGFRLKVNR